MCCSHDDLDALDPMPNLAPHSADIIEICLARQPYLVRICRVHILLQYIEILLQYIITIYYYNILIPSRAPFDHI